MENKNQNTQNKNSLLKLWPVGLIIIVVVALIMLNTQKNNTLPSDQPQVALSGSALTMIDRQQYFAASWFGKNAPTSL